MTGHITGALIAMLIWAGAMPAFGADGTQAPEAAALIQDITRQVALIVAEGDGTLAAGSAVIVGEGLAVTSCHVVRGANTIAVFAIARSFAATVRAADAYLDVCLLSVPGLPARPVVRRASASVAVGEPSFAVGFSQGRLGFSRGDIVARYPMRAAHVLRTSSGFLTGASGGGLFDAQGRLIGVLTFYRQSEAESLYMAVPAQWIDEVIARADATPGAAQADSGAVAPFWDIDPEHDDPQRPRFMQAMTLEAEGRWAELDRFGRAWLEASPDDEGARRTLEIARRRSSR
jgi:S1-C subfamily serine protease